MTALSGVAPDATEAPGTVVEVDDGELGPLQPRSLLLDPPDLVLPAVRIGIGGHRVAIVDQHEPGTGEIDRGKRRRGGQSQ